MARLQRVNRARGTKMYFAPGYRIRTRDLDELQPSVRGAEGVITAPERELHTPGWWVVIDGEQEPRLMLQDWLEAGRADAETQSGSAVATA